ncbi:hypothetical protein PVK06_002901 [Gossypium arboreum]|uniref:Myb/SANT-like domain-containing protein n=1 Tax=Gossypium arboreum TaxID=29729 RepID=A0ABR0R660_GOSAR|nr:hypothetical protein PVK06_002901 [Gossypium arboreum]
MINFEKETSKAFSQRQLKNRWDALKKEWKAWKKLKGEDTGLGWNPIKKTVDALDDWWESRLKVVPEAQQFRTSGIDPEFEGKLDQMFMGIVATGDKAWTPSSGTLRSDFFEDVNNEIHEEDDEENVRNDVHISNDVQIDGNADNMSQATSSLTPIMDPYGIPQAVKVLDSMSEEVPEASPLYFFALRLLLNKDKRIMFLSINPKIRALWLKTEMEDS